MNKDELLIGSHVGMNGPDYYVGSVKEAISYGANTFMFYTGAPQNSFRKPLEELKIEEGRKLLKENGFDESKIVVHAPYIINAANISNPNIYELAINTIISELKRTSGFGCKILVLHPGSHVGLGAEVGIKALAEALNVALACDGTDVKIALETMAGKGKEIGVNFYEIKQIIDQCKYKDRLGVCLDTCHISDAGYDIKNYNKIIEEFDSIVGLDKLLVLHINDSKNPIASHKDRHENIGYGYIGFETLNNIVHDDRLKNIPKILETPYINGVPPYKTEIDMFKQSKYIDRWRD